MDSFVILLIYIGIFDLILFIGGILSDYILPKIKPLMRHIDSLPDWEDE